MARIRTIKPEFWGHWKTARVSRDARLLFLGLLNESDDEGKQLGSPRTVAGVVFPNDDDVTNKHITRWMDELEIVGLVERYEVAGVRYIFLPGFTEHQKVSHPSESRLPSPADEPPELFPTSSGESPESLGPDLGSGSRIVGGAPNGAAARGSRIPDPFDVVPEMELWALSKCPDIDWRLHTTRFVNYYKAVAGKSGVKLDWCRTWQNWLLKEQDSVAKRGAVRTHL